MSDTMTDELSSLRWSPTPLPRVVPHDEWHAGTTLGASELPVMRPGQLWLVELPAIAPDFAPLEYRALSNANVVIYDRVLAPTVARLLPLGGYAEPAAPSDAQPGAGSERCVRFVCDGWSVARLFYPCFQSGRDRLDKIRQLWHPLLSLAMPADLAVQIFVSAGRGRYERNETRLSRLDAIIAGYASVRSSTFTIVLDVTDTGGVPRSCVASANGLAGWDRMTELVITIALVLAFVGALWASGLVHTPWLAAAIAIGAGIACPGWVRAVSCAADELT